MVVDDRAATLNIEIDEDMERGPSDFQLAMHELKRRPPAIFGAVFLVLIIIFALVPGLFSRWTRSRRIWADT